MLGFSGLVLFVALLVPRGNEAVINECKQVIGNTTSQVCLSGNCTFTCGTNASNYDVCDQLCFSSAVGTTPCPLLRCTNPRDCNQRCMIGGCAMLDCMSLESCVQSCSHNCSMVECHSKKCNQHCEKGGCKLVASGVNADQTCSEKTCEDIHCKSTGSCNQECQRGSCKMRCTNSQTDECSQGCNKGSCSFECAAKSCESTCSHGNCPSMSCKSGQNCTQLCDKGCNNVECSSENCRQTCSGQDCNLKCTNPSGTCSQNCKGSCKTACESSDCDVSCSGKGCDLQCPKSQTKTCDLTVLHAGGSGSIDCNAETCKMKCVDGDCPTVACSGKNCTQRCSGGGCAKMICSATICDLSCEGGNCKEMTCTSNVESCTMKCSKGNCNMRCDSKAAGCSLADCKGCTTDGSGLTTTEAPPKGGASACVGSVMALILTAILVVGSRF